MDITHLEYFQVVARTQHMTEAARQLHIAQPALSTIIARLEERVGVPLFDRVGRTIQLNSYGKIYLREVDAALAHLEEARREISDLAGQREQHIALAVATLNQLSNLLAPYLAQYPQTKFKITQASSEQEKLLLLERNEVDFFITNEPLGQAGIHHVHLATDKMMIVVPPGHRLAGLTTVKLEDVAEEGFVCLKRGYHYREQIEAWCAEAGFAPKIVCEGDEPASIARLVMTGLGIALLPARSQAEKTGMVYIDIAEPTCRITYYLAWLEGRYQSVAAHTFRDYVIRHFPGHSAPS